MISLEQAKKFYPKGQCPNDQELMRILAMSYAVAEREWEEMKNEEYENDHRQ